MKVKSLQVRNFKSFEDSGLLDLGSVNVLVGPNNSGKSVLLRALGALQMGMPVEVTDIRVGQNQGTIDVVLTEVRQPNPWDLEVDELPCKIRLTYLHGVYSLGLTVAAPAGVRNGAPQISQVEPFHFIHPVLGQRKVQIYSQQIRKSSTLTVFPNFTELVSKVSRVANPEFPGAQTYRQACKEILGFVVSAIATENGQEPGVFVNGHDTISIRAMGDGVPHIVGLLADLCLADGKLFLIEEPENDLHPRALKALLELILESARNNQFVITTHSNIVVKYLGSNPESTLFYVDSIRNPLPPVATCRRLSNDPKERLSILDELGYELYDFDLWDGWLILEESSAERIIRDYLIPWFAPKLQRVRTLSAGGTSKVGATFDDFNRLFLFTHLERRYFNRAWVLVDGDETGKRTIEQLKIKYPLWRPDSFRTFDEANFESYYPQGFGDRVRELLRMNKGDDRRVAKAKLLDEVRAWADEDQSEAKKAFFESAETVIELLRDIEECLFPTRQSDTQPVRNQVELGS